MGKGEREEKEGQGQASSREEASGGGEHVCVSHSPFPSGWIILAPPPSIFSISAPPLQLVPSFLVWILSSMPTQELLQSEAGGGAESFSSRQLRAAFCSGEAMWGQPGEGGGCAGGERSEGRQG